MPHAQRFSKTASSQAGKFGCLPIFGLLLLTVVITIAGTVWAIQSPLFNKEFEPVELSAPEQATLEQKLNALGSSDTTFSQSLATDTQSESATQEGVGEINLDSGAGGELQPELYTEDDSKRRIELTERELNALLAKNTDLAEQLVIDLTDNLASFRLLYDIDRDAPFVGGKTLKVSGGTELSYQNGQPVIVLKGVSVWGMPVPNAWLQGLKNVDLVREFGGSDGFWKSLADGIEDISVQDGKLLIQLAE